MEEKPSKKSYSASDIQVLEGLEPVRKRPGMYIGSTGLDGLHHLIWEVMDNSIDEAMGGFGKRISIYFEKDNIVRETDEGRGIPVEIHPQTKKSTLETVLTTLHAGAKFGSGAYKISGGLHGVGVSVVCALSQWMRAEVHRDGFLYAQEYKKGVPQGPVKKIGKSEGSGTTIIFQPDSTIFKTIEFSFKKVLSHVRDQAFLTPGVWFHLEDLTKETPVVYNFLFENGVKSFLQSVLRGSKTIHPNIFTCKGEKDGIYAEVAMAYTDDIETEELCFANNVINPEGGTHLTGFRSALTRTIQNWARQEGYLKGAESFESTDVREGLSVVISTKIPNPEFEGQTKAKLGNPEARGAIESLVAAGLQEFFEKNPQDMKAILEKCLLAKRARQAAKAAKESVLRKGLLEGLALPGKLADCTSKDPQESELFIVEGDSAGGSSKSGRDRRFQAILPLRGKILNVEKVHLSKILASDSVRSLIIALGTAIGDDFNAEKLRYNKIIFLADADVDGSHIRTLLMTLFFRYFPKLVEEGHVYAAVPPLYKIQSGKIIRYAFSDEEKDAIIKKDFKGKIPDVARYKGLGEMNPDQLWETTLNPENRKLLRIDIEDAQKTDEIFDILMGKEVAPRKKFIQTYAKEVRNLDI